MSGLRSVKRDFSSKSFPSGSQGSTTGNASAIPWEATPPKKERSGLSERLRHIQEGIDASLRASESALGASQSTSFSQPLKRPASSQVPPAKRRQLPDSWNDEQSYPSGAKRRSFGTERSANSESTVVPAKVAAGAPTKPGAVDLSAEQKHILQLVQDGQSLFYTGSAGECDVRPYSWWLCSHLCCLSFLISRGRHHYMHSQMETVCPALHTQCALSEAGTRCHADVRTVRYHLSVYMRIILYISTP